MNKDSLLLSICITTYNRAIYLTELLESIKANWADDELFNKTIEIVISDNASKDNTSAVIKRYISILPINYHRNKTNVGPEKNIRIVSSLAKGKYIWFFSDDDIMCGHALAILTGFLSHFPDISFVYYSRQLVGKNFEYKKKLIQPYGVGKNIIFKSGKELFHSLNGQMPSILFFFSSIIIQRRDWEESTKLQKKILEGWWHGKIILKAIVDKKCAVLKGPGVLCRLNNSAETSSFVWMDNYIKIFLFAKELGYSEKRCNSMIQSTIIKAEKIFVIDKMSGNRTDSITECLENLGVEDLLLKETVLTRLSRLPVNILRLGYPLYILQRFIKIKWLNYFNNC